MILIELARPEWFLLIPFLLAITLLSHYFAHKIKKSLEVFHYPPVYRLIRISARKDLRKHSWRSISLALKITIVLLTAFSLAGPTLATVGETSRIVEVPMVEEKDVVHGIILAVDVSSSMGFGDVNPSRLDAVKSMLVEFVGNASEKVRFGIVTFDAEIRSSLPLTEDKGKVVSALEELKPSDALPCLEEVTDVGYGIKTAVAMLTPYTSSPGPYAIVLVSDGYANYGFPDPFSSVSSAVKDAANKTIPIYAVHIAKIGLDSNPQLMQFIADETAGKFMESTSIEELRSVLDLLAKYHVPLKQWSAKIEIKTSIPQRIELGHILMIGAIIAVLLLWVGNYKHYKTWF